MRKWLSIIGIALVLILIAGVVWLRGYAVRRAGASLLNPAPAGNATPGDLGLSYSSFRIPVEERSLQAWIVRAPDTNAIGTAVLVYHGNGTSIADQIGIVQTLYARGITTMVFDYSGFGASGGEATIPNLRQDAEAAFRTFADSMGVTTRKFVLATSLGAAVFLDVAPDLQGVVDGIVLVGTFASGRELAVRRGQVPSAVAFLIPDPYDNEGAIARIEKPVLIVHSDRDQVFPISDAERLVEAAGGVARLIRADSPAHDAYLADSGDWEPVLQFLTARP